MNPSTDLCNKAINLDHLIRARRVGDFVRILGGNQSNRVRISTYPKDGVMGGTRYRLRSYRRG